MKRTSKRKPLNTASPVQPDERLNRIWQSVFCPYREHPNTALTLAQNFQLFKDTLSDPQSAALVIRSLDDAIEMLFQYSTFYSKNVGSIPSSCTD